MLPKTKQAHVDAWQASGLTQSAYSRKHGLNSKTFNRWCKLTQTDSKPTPKLLPIIMKSPSLAQDTNPIRVQLPSGAMLELPVDVSPRWLGELLQCLE